MPRTLRVLGRESYQLSDRLKIWSSVRQPAGRFYVSEDLGGEELWMLLG